MSDSISAPARLPEFNMKGPFLFLRGGFDLGPSAVPYFSVTLPAEEAATVIKLPSELPVSPERPVELDELFQRELDEKRARDEIVRYLSRPDALRFFNSLTVVLLPLHQSGTHLDVADEYSHASDVGPEPTIGGFDNTSIGQITISMPSEQATHGYISWNPRYTFPVVLDGQHRLFAIKEALADPAFPQRNDLANTRISVLFVVLDPRAGYHSPVDRSVLSACRKIFTDLNKYAKSVSRSRQYLLDETDVAAGCLRSVLERAVDASPDGTISDRVERNHRLPLALVDWRSETAKFDGNSVYLSTVLSLHGIVGSILDEKDPDPENYEAWRRLVGRLTARLLGSTEANALREGIVRRLDANEEDEVPFALRPAEVAQLATGFRNRYGSRITRPFVLLRPYRDLVDAYEEAELLSSPMEPWFALNPEGRRQLLTKLEVSDPLHRIEEISQRLKSDHLAFQVVFQRATTAALHGMASFPDEVRTHWREDGLETTESDFVRDWCSLWNARIEPAMRQGAGRDSPFVGAGVRPEGNIDYRKTRIPGISGFMVYCLLAPKDWWLEGVDMASVEAWIRRSFALIQRGGHADPLKNLYSRFGARWRRGLEDVVIARGSEVSEDSIIELAAEQIVSMMVGAE